MEQKGFMEIDSQKRLPPNYQSISADPSPRLGDNPPPYYSQPQHPIGYVQPTIIIQPSTTQSIYFLIIKTMLIKLYLFQLCCCHH